MPYAGGRADDIYSLRRLFFSSRSRRAEACWPAVVFHYRLSMANKLRRLYKKLPFSFSNPVSRSPEGKILFLGNTGKEWGTLSLFFFFFLTKPSCYTVSSFSLSSNPSRVCRIVCSTCCIFRHLPVQLPRNQRRSLICSL